MKIKPDDITKTVFYDCIKDEQIVRLDTKVGSKQVCHQFTVSGNRPITIIPEKEIEALEKLVLSSYCEQSKTDGSGKQDG